MVVAAFALVSVFVGLPAFFSSLDDTPAARRHKAQADLASLVMSVNQALERHPIDPWGKPYVYRARAEGPPELYSLGPNGIDEHAKGDDISVSAK